jgi:hypothetical protein
MLFIGEHGQNQQTNVEEALAISQVADQFLESFGQVAQSFVEYECQNEVGDLKPCKISKVQRHISRNNILYYRVQLSCQRQISP